MKRLILASLLVAGIGVGGWVSAQQRPVPGPEPRDAMALVAPVVISGSDFGFRMESTREGVVTGRLVVRVKGVWVDAQVGSPGVVPAR